MSAANPHPPQLPHEPLRYAGFGVRLGAHLLDSLIFITILYPVLLAVYGFDYFLDALGPALEPLSARSLLAPGPFRPVEFVMRWVFPAVAVVLLWTYRAATPGKMIFDTRIVDARTGGRLGVRQSAIRYVAYAVAALPLGLGFLWVLFDRRKQGWHDKLAGTVVVRPGGRGAPATFAAAPAAGPAREAPSPAHVQA